MKSLSVLLSFMALNVYSQGMFSSEETTFGIDQFPDASKHYTSGVDRGFSKYLTRSAYGTKKISLTFDDGPHPTRTPRLLNILKKHNVQATFFIVTQKVTEKTKYIIEQMLLDGHYVASHHHFHNNSNKETQTKWKANLTKSVKIIEEIENESGLFQNQMFYRFPYGAYGSNKAYHHLNVMKEVSSDLYGKNCINFVFWDVDTVDWLSNMTAQNIKQNIIGQVNGGTAYRHVKVNGKFTKKAYTISKGLGGGVVLMHDIHKKSVDATELFLEEIDKHDLEIVPLDSFKEFAYNDISCKFL